MASEEYLQKNGIERPSASDATLTTYRCQLDGILDFHVGNRPDLRLMTADEPRERSRGSQAYREGVHLVRQALT